MATHDSEAPAGLAQVEPDTAPPPVGADTQHRLTRGLDEQSWPDAARHARHFAAEACARWQLPEDVTDAVALLTSELVTNAVRYAPPPLQLTVERGPGGVVVTCSDSSPQPPAPSRPDLEAEGGRGTWLIEMLASSWGYEVVGSPKSSVGKRVWFLVDGPPHRHPPSARPL